MFERSFVSVAAVVGVFFAATAWTGCSDDNDSSSDRRPDASSAKDASSSVPDTSTPSTDKDAADEGDDFDAGPAAPITYGTCETFTPCGGDITGTWRVKGGCVSSQALADLKQGACTGVAESDVVVTAAGTVSATATSLQRKMKTSMTAKVAVPKACVDSLIVANCQTVEAGLSTPGLLSDPAPFDTATCTSDGAGGCNCDVARALTENVTADYSVAGNTISTTDPERAFEYCVNGDTLTYVETTGGEGFSFPITVELEKE